MSQPPTGCLEILGDGFPTAHLADTPDHTVLAAKPSTPHHGLGPVFRPQMLWGPTMARHPSTLQNEQSALVSPGAIVGIHGVFAIPQDFPSIPAPPEPWQPWPPSPTAFLSSFQVSPFYTQYHTLQIPTSNQPGRSGDTSPPDDTFQAYHPHPVGQHATDTNALFPFTGQAVMASRHEQSYNMPIPCNISCGQDATHGWSVVDYANVEFGHMSSSVGSDGSTSSSPLDGPFPPIPSFRDPLAEVYADMTAAEPTPPSKTPNSGARGPLEPKNPRKRGALAPAEREQTGKTRQISACLRCQMQRKRVGERQPINLLSVHLGHG